MSENINQAHRLTIGASQVSRIMSYLQHDNLPKGAVSLIETMCRGTDKDLENAYELNTPAVIWGRDHEVEAIELIAAEFEADAQFYGDNQLRLNAGHEYSNIISALCDAHLILKDGSIIIPEVKCLDTKNHDYIVAVVGDSADALKREDWDKYCQVHTQNICAEMYYEKPVSSIIVFYDPRSTAIKLHYVIVVDADDQSTIDHEFRDKLKQRAMLARNLYDSIKSEPDQVAVVFDGVMPETKLVKSQEGFVLTPALLSLGVEAIAREAAKSVGVDIAELVIENDKIISYHLKGGEVFNCEVKEGRDLSEKLEKKLKKIVPLVKKANAPQREKALAEHRNCTKIDRLIEGLILPIIAHVGAGRAEWIAEQERIQQEALAAEAEKQRAIAEKAEQVRSAILTKIDTFTVSPQDVSSLELIAAKRLHVESVIIDVMFGEFEQQALEAKEKALIDLTWYEDLLKNKAEQDKKREAELVEQGRLAAEQASKDALAKAEREKLEAEQREKQAVEAMRIAKEMEKQRLIEEEDARVSALVKAENDRLQAVEDERKRVEAEAAKQKAIDDARKADIEHRAAIKTAVKIALIDAGLTEEQAINVVKLACSGKLGALKIEF